MDVSSQAPDEASKRCDAHWVIVYQRVKSQTGKRVGDDDAEEEAEKETRLTTADLSQQPHQIRVIVHNDPSDSLENVLLKWFTELGFGFSIEGVSKGRRCNFTHNA